jgi:hypothetical protein
VQRACHARRCVQFNRVSCANICRNFASGHDASSDENVSRDGSSVANNKDIVSTDIAFELAIETYATFEKQFPFEASSTTQEGVDFGGPMRSGVSRGIGALKLLILCRIGVHRTLGLLYLVREAN